MSKQKYTLEYPVRCSPTILYEFLLYIQRIKQNGSPTVWTNMWKYILFGWNGSQEEAEVLDNEPDKFINFIVGNSQKMSILNLELINPK